MTAGLLAIFLGGLGIHRFYLGQWWGIFYLLFVWTLIPAIIALIEGIVFLCTSDQNWPAKPGERRYAVGKHPTAALLLSLFLPAVGQFYNGDTKKGLVILGGYFYSFLLGYYYIGLLTGLGLWIWSVIDAHSVASGKGPLWSWLP